jgi:hypothetical protein
MDPTGFAEVGILWRLADCGAAVSGSRASARLSLFVHLHDRRGPFAASRNVRTRPGIV